MEGWQYIIMMYVWWLDRIHIVLGNILFHRFFADYYHLWQIRIAGRNITSTHSLLYFSFIFVIKKKKKSGRHWMSESLHERRKLNVSL